MVRTHASTIRGLCDAATSIEADAPSLEWLQAVIDRGVFRPAEDEAIGFWFARLLTLRENLKALIDELAAEVGKPVTDLEHTELRYFIIGYAAACTLVRIDRLLLFQVASHSLVQRKLNEVFPEYRIPRKQYTAIYRWFVDHRNAMAMLDAMAFAKQHRHAILMQRDDPDIGFIVEQFPDLEASLDPSTRNYVRRALDYVSHKWRRRGKRGAESVLAAMLEGFGRAASEFREKDRKRVTDSIRHELTRILEPGDVLVTRHAVALTNLFLPGFWPHAALYVGTPEQRDALGIDIDEARLKRWSGDVATLEALKDGVRLRPLAETLFVDSFVVLRPADAETARTAIERALVHEGKKYNFDFDFFTSDRMVCTEVIYRAYDGLGDISIPLMERGGRKTLSAEDLLDYALDSAAFEPVAIFGVPGVGEDIVTGESVRELLVNSYRG